MNKIKKGDQVVVIAGKDKGKRGAVLTVLDDGAKLIVEGVNEAKKAVKPNPNANEEGGLKTKLMPIHRSNVMVYDGKKGSRVGIRILKDGQRKRYFKSNDELVDAK
jgi:large subunit ribosomal protein L24